MGYKIGEKLRVKQLLPAITLVLFLMFSSVQIMEPDVLENGKFSELWLINLIRLFLSVNVFLIVISLSVLRTVLIISSLWMPALRMTLIH